MSEPEERPVLAGLAALVAVALGVGLLAGLGVLSATKVLGVGGETDSSSGATRADSLYLPEPTDTGEATGPSVTLAPTEPSTDSEPAETESEKPSKRAKPINLSASQVSVSPMQQIDLTGTYPAGEGAILQVQRREGGSWKDFPVTASVGGGTFSTYVQTSQTGKNLFRVRDTDSGATSNRVAVTVG